MLNKRFSVFAKTYIKIFEGNDFTEIYKVLSELKNKKLKFNKIVIEKYENMNEKGVFEQMYYGQTATGSYKNAQNSTR